MDVSVGGSPGQGASENVLAQNTTTTSSTTTVENKTPLEKQPVQDQVSVADQSIPKPITNYVATFQMPVLPKPEEKKEEKKTETKDNFETQEASTETADNEMQAEGESINPDQEGGQGTGGGTDDSEGGDSGSGNFSGQDQSSSDPSTGTSGTEKTQFTAASTSLNAAAQTKPDAMEKASEEIDFVDPLNESTVVTPTGMFAPPKNAAQFLSNGEKLMTEIYQANMKFIETMPEGPDKIIFTDFLKLVQEALIGFQELLRSMQTMDSKGARERSQAKLETTLAKIEKQRKEMDEIHRKQAEAAQKMKMFAPLMIILVILLVFLLPLVMLAGPMGWFILLLMVAEITDTCAQLHGQKPFMMKKLVEAVTTITDAMVDSFADNYGLSPQQRRDQKLIAKTVAISIAAALAVIANPLIFALGGVAALTSFLEESHIIRDMQKRAGANEKDAMMAEMYATIALTAAFAVAGLAAAMVMPGGVATIIPRMVQAVTRAAIQAAKIVLAVIRFFIKIAEATAKKLLKLFQAMFQVMLDPEVWVSATSLGLQTTSAVMTYRHETLLAEIAIIQGQMDSEVELKETTIMILKKMIKQLLDGLQGTGDQIVQIGQLLKKTHADVSQVASNFVV